MVEQGETKPNKLHRAATSYVSANAQAYLIKKMLEEQLMTAEEEIYYRRGRNAKSHTSAIYADIATYRIATGFEALMGYLHLTKQTERMEELIRWCIQKVGEKNE